MANTVVPNTAARRLLDQLVQERGLAPGTYAYFFTTQEGRILSGSTEDAIIENATGYVIDRTGRVFSFWLDWDKALGRPAFVQWGQTEPELDWLESDEYRQAREAVGLAPVG